MSVSTKSKMSTLTRVGNLIRGVKLPILLRFADENGWENDENCSFCLMNHNPTLSDLLAEENNNLYLYDVELVLIPSKRHLRLHYHEQSESVVLCLSDTTRATYWIGSERQELTEHKLQQDSVVLIGKKQFHDFVAGDESIYLLIISTPPIDHNDVHFVEF